MAVLIQYYDFSSTKHRTCSKNKQVIKKGRGVKNITIPGKAKKETLKKNETLEERDGRERKHFAKIEMALFRIIAC